MSNTTVTQPTSLYERLGRSEGISRLVDDIVEAHMTNPVISARFLPYRDDPVKTEQVKKHLCGFLAAGTGGPERYEGRSLPDAHRGMNISEAEYMAALDDILDTLRRHGADEPTQRDILAIAYSLKGEILRV